VSDKRVAIMTPAYGGMIHIQNAQSVAHTMSALNDHGWDVGWIHYGNVAATTKVRNAMVSEALQNNYTDLVFIDSDIAFKPEALLQLLNHDLDLVGGVMRSNVYLNDPESPEKAHPFPYAVEPLLDEQGQPYFHVDNGVAQVASVATAFMRMRAEPLKDVMSQHPELQYYDERVAGTRDYLYALFDYRIYPHPMPGLREEGLMKYHGEDYAFCNLWRESGYKVHADLTIPLRHIKTVNLDGLAIRALETLAKKKIMKAEEVRDEGE